MIMSRIISSQVRRSVSVVALSVRGHCSCFTQTDNGPEITKCIREVLKDDYNYDSTVRSTPTSFFSDRPCECPQLIYPFPQNSFYALWRSFTQCMFIEEDGGIVFYKNKYGEAARELAPGALGQLQPLTDVRVNSMDVKSNAYEGSCEVSRGHVDVVSVDNASEE